MLWKQGDLAGALQHYRRALGIDEKVFGSEHPDVAIDINNIGSVGCSLCSPQLQSQVGSKLILCVHCHVQVLYAQGDMSEARKYFQRAVDMRSKFLGSGHADTQSALQWLRLCSEEEEDGDQE